MPPKIEAATNVLDLSVSELSAKLKRTVEDAYGYVRVRGEISGFRGVHASGHAYFCLKDENARLDAVVWRTSFGRLRFKPQEGLEVVASGKLTTYPGKSSYQLVIEQLEPAGVGALMALLDQRRKALAAEGLFDTARKRPLPWLPEVIGIVTSPSGSVIRDILHRLEDRFPRRVIVWPVRVQGETCAAEVSAAIDGFNALPADGQIPRPDLIIVARGGGSLEDLWGFNEEAVVRAAAASAIPLISAVGHETDTTLIDLAADMRAPTPTAAAEMAVPVRAELAALLKDLGARLAGSAQRGLERRRAEMRALVRALPGADRILALPRQRADFAGSRLAPALSLYVRARRDRLRAASPDASALRLRLAAGRRQTTGLETRLERAISMLGARLRARLERSSVRLQPALLADIRAHRRRLQPLLGRDLGRPVADMINRRGTQLDDMAGRGGRAMRRRLDGARERLAGLWSLAEALSYKKVLSRGFALVRGAAGEPVTHAGSVAAGAKMSLQFADGRVGVRAEEAGAPAPEPEPKPRKAGPARKAPLPGPGQGSLF